MYTESALRFFEKAKIFYRSKREQQIHVCLEAVPQHRHSKPFSYEQFYFIVKTYRKSWNTTQKL